MLKESEFKASFYIAQFVELFSCTTNETELVPSKRMLETKVLAEVLVSEVSSY